MNRIGTPNMAGSAICRSRGENAGRTLPHKDVVKALVRLGSWSGAAEVYRLPAAAPGLKTALLIQDGPGGPILAATRL